MNRDTYNVPSATRTRREIISSIKLNYSWKKNTNTSSAMQCDKVQKTMFFLTIDNFISEI